MTKMICGSLIVPVLLGLPIAAMARQEADNGPPVHSVRDEIGTGIVATDANEALFEMHAIEQRCRFGGDSIPAAEGAAARERYGRFYREVRSEIDGLDTLAGQASSEAQRADYQSRADDLRGRLSWLPIAERFGCGAAAPPAITEDFTGTARLNQLVRPAGTTFAAEPVTLDEEGALTAPLGIAALVATYSREQIAGTGIGFQRDGAPGAAPEKFAAELPTHADLWGGSARIGYGGWEATGQYAQGSVEASASIPATLGSGTVYGELSPGGSSGISAPFGVDARIEADVEQWGLGLGHVFTLASPAPARRFAGITITPHVAFERRQTQVRASASASGTANGFLFQFAQDRQHDLAQEHYEAGARLDARWETSYGLAVEVGVEAGAYLFEHRLYSLESNRNNFTGAPDDSFTVSLRHDDNGLGVRGLVTFGLYFGLADNVEAGVTAAAGYRSAGATVFNPSSGDQVFLDGLGTTLERQSLDFAGVGIGLRIGL